RWFPFVSRELSPLVEGSRAYGQAAYGSSLATLIRAFPTWPERPGLTRKTDIPLSAHSATAYSFVVCARSSFRRSTSSNISFLEIGLTSLSASVLLRCRFRGSQRPSRSCP